MRVRTAALVLAILAAASFDAPAQKAESRPGPDAAALCAKLRGGAWTIEDLESLLPALLAQKQIRAADWWVRAAENAVAAGMLPARSKSSIAEARRQVDLFDKPSVEGRLLWTAAVEHTKALADKKAFEEATRALAVAERLAALYPDPAWKRDAAALRARLPKDLPESGGQAADEKARLRTAELRKRLDDEIASRTSGAVEQFRRFGCREGFEIVEALLRRQPPGERFVAELRAFRTAARGFGLAKPLLVHILAPVKITVHQDGAPLAEQTAYDASDWRDVKLAALPGEVVAFEVRLPGDAPVFATKDGGKIPYAELYLEAVYDGKGLGRDAWQVGSLEQSRAPKPRVGGILFADVGPNPRVRTEGGRTPVCMNYAEPAAKRNEALVIDAGMTEEDATNALVGSIVSNVHVAQALPYGDAHKAREKKVPGPRAGFVWATTMRENPVYFLIIPQDAAR